MTGVVSSPLLSSEEEGRYGFMSRLTLGVLLLLFFVFIWWALKHWGS